MRIYIDFHTPELCEYFLSIEADHWWYLPILYDTRKENITTISLSAKFQHLLNIKGNFQEFFSIKKKSDGKLVYQEFVPKPIIYDK